MTMHVKRWMPRREFALGVSVVAARLALAAVGPADALCLEKAICLEAEQFSDCGGWVVDSQFIDQMGSSFLLAHGAGVPVSDAKTTFAVSQDGVYDVWAYTRNWTAPWSEHAAGTFEVRIEAAGMKDSAWSGCALGTGGGEWRWQKAGTVKLCAGTASLALHDQTGFDGRCDAVCLTPAGVEPPKRGPRQLVAAAADVQEVPADFVVCGGGVAGTCAAISAARLGLKVALVQDRPVLGGANSSEVRVHLGGDVNLGPYPRLGDVVAEIGPARGGNAQPASTYEDRRKLDAVAAEKNIRLFLDTRIVAVEKSGTCISSALGRDVITGRYTRFSAPLFADCTGDGSVGALAGADFRMGRESKAETGEPLAPDAADTMTMGASVQWYATERSGTVGFPSEPWMLPFGEGSCEQCTRGDWDWETGMMRDQIAEFERIRDYGMLVVYSNWSFLKNRSEKKAQYANRALDWVAYVAGKRESRRLMGDHILCQQDLAESRPYPDGTCCATWSIDLHYPMPRNVKCFDGEPFRSVCTHERHHAYPIPYRCLYSRNVPNLFMAGRNISVTHVALGTTRVMRTTGMMGEVVGMAARVCRTRNCLPRGVYEAHLDDLRELMRKGVGTGVKQPPQNYNSGAPVPVERPVKVTFVGDVMCQGPMLETYRTSSGWDFSGIFADTKDLFAESDCVIANLETPIAPDDRDLTCARWQFCSPKAFARAVRDSGVDFVFTANNHCLDRGPAGVVRTVEALDAVGLPHTGTFATKEASKVPAVIDVKGFRLGLVAYTYGSNAFCNNQYLDESNRFMVNLFQRQELSDPLARAWIADRNSPDGRKYEEMERKRRPENLTLPVYERQEDHDSERARLKEDVARLKAEMPDFTVMSMHTGGQYNPVATKYTKELVSFLFGCGIDIIAGTHEHVVHGGEFDDIGRGRLATYSLGNFNSLNGVWEDPMDKMADYSVAWHVYLDRDARGQARLAKTSFSVLKCIRGDRANAIRVVPAADLYCRENDPVSRHKLREDILVTARRFAGRDYAALGVVPEYPVEAGSASAPSVTVDDRIPAGNIIFEKIVGDDVYVHQDLRDTKGDWFYWAMRVKGAAGRTLRFHFTETPAVGVRGPCVSLDRGKTFAFAAEKGRTCNEFSYEFPNDADEVWFYETVPYLQKDWDDFLARHSAQRGKVFETGVLCRSRKGREVEKARFGCLAPDPRHRIFLSARRHCSESMASFVLEGLLECVFADDETGRWLRENVEFMVVPFMDKDGVEAGDQGKNRRPHDHNRDYTEFIYPETRGIRDWIAAHAGNRLDVFFDFHCPGLFGGHNECVYQVHGPQKENVAKMMKFGKLLEKVQSGGMAYRETDDIRWNVDWNGPANYSGGRAVKAWALEELSCGFVSELEIPFANANGNMVTPESCRELGRDTAKAFCAFLLTDATGD